MPSQSQFWDSPPHVVLLFLNKAKETTIPPSRTPTKLSFSLDILAVMKLFEYSLDLGP